MICLWQKFDIGFQEIAQKIGEVIAKSCLEKGITKVVFDRGGFLYHGRIKALADSAREHGLEFWIVQMFVHISRITCNIFFSPCVEQISFVVIRLVLQGADMATLWSCHVFVRVLCSDASLIDITSIHLSRRRYSMVHIIYSCTIEWYVEHYWSFRSESWVDDSWNGKKTAKKEGFLLLSLRDVLCPFCPR